MGQADELPPKIRALLDIVRINAPLIMLFEGWLDRFLEWGIQPEIGFDWRALDIPRKDLKMMARRMAGAGLRTTAHGPFMDLASGARDPLILKISRERYARALEAAALFSPAYMVFHPSYEKAHHTYYRSEWLETNLETWRTVIHRADDLGIRAILENTYETGPFELEPLLAGLAADGVGFCLDFGHAQAFGETDITVWLQTLAPYLEVLHLHDNNGDCDEHLALGAGRIDFRAYLTWLVERDIRPSITLEPHHEEHLWPSLSTLADLWPWHLPT